jgi:hypothetical protein
MSAKCPRPEARCKWDQLGYAGEAKKRRFASKSPASRPRLLPNTTEDDQPRLLTIDQPSAGIPGACQTSGRFTVLQVDETQSVRRVDAAQLDIDQHTSAIRLTDLSEAIQAAKEVFNLFNSDAALWRGHGNADWPLLAQVFRRTLEHPEVPLYYDEHSLIGHFMSRAETRTQRTCPSSEDYFDWLFLAQHYGLPTRLLDWSENLLFALYFAVVEKEQKDKDGCIWALWPERLNAHFGSTSGFVQIRDPKVVEIAKCAFDPQANCEQVIIAIDGREIDPRMLAQMSRFTLHSYHEAMEILPTSASWLRRYVIPKEAKSEIRAQLAALGIRRSNLFPDLSNLAAEVKEMRFGDPLSHPRSGPVGGVTLAQLRR